MPPHLTFYKEITPMKTLLLGCILLSSSLLADESTKFSEIEAVLKGSGDSVKVPTEVDAKKVLLGGIGKPTGGISAYWSWSIRDAFVLPNDWEGVGKAGEAVWIGQLNSLNEAPLGSQPLAIYFINATTGHVFTLKRPARKKTAESGPRE